MEKIVYWSKTNPRKVRLIIIAGRTYLAFMASWAGLWLAWKGIDVAYPLFLGAAGLSFAAFVFYPRGFSLFCDLRRRKSLEFVALVSALLFYAGLGNFRPLTGGTAAGTQMPKVEVLEATMKRDIKAPIKPEEFRQVRQKIRSGALRIEKNMFAAASDLSTDQIIGLILLSLLIFVLIGALSCGIFCAGGGEGGVGAWFIIWFAASALFIYLMWRNAIRKQERRTSKR